MAEVIIRVYNSKLIAKPGVAAPDWFDLDVDQATSPLKLDISAVEIGELGTNFGIGSQQFALPNTPTNNDFFNYAFDIGSDESGFTFQKSFACQILVDGGSIASGKLYFDSVTTNHKGKHFYNCTFSDAVSSITDVYKDTLLADLNWSAYTHNLTVQNITGSWDNLLFSGSIIYPNVLYGYPEGDTTWAWNANYFADDATSYVTTNNIPLNAFKPAVKVKTIFDKIFDSINYEYESNFISNSTSSFGAGVTASFSDLYMLMTPNAELGPTISTPVADAEWVRTSTYSTFCVASSCTGQINLSTALGAGTEVFDPLGMINFNSTNDVTFPLGGNYRIEPGFTFQTDVTSDIEIRLENITTGDYWVLLNGNLTAGQDYTHNQAIELLDVVAGTVYQFRYVFYYSCLSGGCGTANFYFKNQNFKIDNVAYNSGPVDMGIQFGDLKVADFLKGLSEQFNLVWWADKENPKKVYIEPWNTYIASGNELDWSNKVDYSVNWEISHPSADAEKTILFANVEDDDSPNQYYIVNDNVPFGSYTYQAQSDYADGEKTIGQSFFAPTIVKPIPGTNAVSAQSNMTIPHIYTDGYLPRPRLVKFKPRLLFKNGKQNYSFPYSVASQTLTTYYQMSPATNLSFDAAKFDLNFSSYNWYWGADNVVSYDHYTDNDSFNVFWANYINNIYRNPARKVTLNIKFEPVDLFTFRVNDLIFIDGQTYLINKISGFDLLKPASTQVELIKALYPSYNKPVFIVEGNDDIQVPGQGDPNDNNVGDEWVFEPDTGDPVRVVPTNIVNGSTVSVDSIKKTLIRQQGFLPSGSIVWKDIRWDKQTLNTNIKDNLQYGINAGGVQSPNTITLGGKNDVNSVTSNVLVTGNTNTVSLSNKNLNVIGDNNNLELGNSNLLYIGNNSNSGVRYFSSSLIMDISSGSNNLNKDSVYKVGIFALNDGIELEGSHNGSVVIANVNSGSNVTSIGKTGYSVDNSFFMGNDKSNLSPNSSSISNFFVVNNSQANITQYTQSQELGRMTIMGNDGVSIKGRVFQSALINNYGASMDTEASAFPFLNTMVGNFIGLAYAPSQTTIIGNDDIIVSSSATSTVMGNVSSVIRDISFNTLIGNSMNFGPTTGYNNNAANLVANNTSIAVPSADYSVILNNHLDWEFFTPGLPYDYPRLVSSSQYSALINNHNFYTTQSSYSNVIGNDELHLNGGKLNNTLFIGNKNVTGSGIVDYYNTAVINTSNTRFTGSSAQSYDDTLIINSEGNTYRGAYFKHTSLNDSSILWEGGTQTTTTIGNYLTTISGSNSYGLVSSNVLSNLKGGTANIIVSNYFSTLANSTYSTYLNNTTFVTSGSISYTNFQHNNSLTVSASSVSYNLIANNNSHTLDLGGNYNVILNNSAASRSRFRGNNNLIANNSNLSTSGSFNNTAFINNFSSSITGSTSNRNTFINISSSIIDIGSGNTMINTRGEAYDIGSNKTMLGTNWLSGYNFWYSDFSLAETAPAIFIGNSEATLYQNVPAQAHTSGGLFTGKQFHYGGQYHGYEYIVGTSGSTNTVKTSANTILLDWFSTAGTSIVNLPLAFDHDGMRIWFKATGNISATKIMRLTATGGERIDAGTTYDMKTGYQGMIIQAMDGQWWIMSEQ